MTTMEGSGCCLRFVFLLCSHDLLPNAVDCLLPSQRGQFLLALLPRLLSHQLPRPAIVFCRVNAFGPQHLFTQPLFNRHRFRRLAQLHHSLLSRVRSAAPNSLPSAVHRIPQLALLLGAADPTTD